MKKQTMKTRKYPQYTGSKKWRVTHPDFPGRSEVVIAPDADSASFVGAGLYGMRWQELRWHDQAVVERM